MRHDAAGNFASLDREAFAQAVRRTVSAVTDAAGGDCVLYARIAAGVLEQLGIPARAMAGSAAWRVGGGDSDVLSHARELAGAGMHVPLSGRDGTELPAAMFHAWALIEAHPPVIVDCSTWSLVDKARALDAADGGKTSVQWSPACLFARADQVVSLHEVRQAHHAGAFFYARHADIEQMLGLERPDAGLDRAVAAALVAYRTLAAGQRVRLIGVDEHGLQPDDEAPKASYRSVERG